MLHNSARLTKSQQGRDSSPFSSPNSNLHASPIAARRGSLEERRRPAANFNGAVLPGLADGIDEEDQEEEDQEEDDQEEELDEDDAGELSPLLPIFSAAQLGTLTLASSDSMIYSSNPSHRCFTGLQSHSYPSPPHRATMRNHSLLGPATLPTSVAVPHQTHSATD